MHTQATRCRHGLNFSSRYVHEAVPSPIARFKLGKYQQYMRILCSGCSCFPVHLRSLFFHNTGPDIAVYVQMSAFKHYHIRTPSGYLSCNSNISTPGHLCSDPIRKTDPTSKEQNPARRADVPSISPLPLPRPSVSYPESCK